MKYQSTVKTKKKATRIDCYPRSHSDRINNSIYKRLNNVEAITERK